MSTQESLFDLFEPEPEQTDPPQAPETPTADDPQVQRRIDALVPCRACPRRTGPEWAAFSGGLCLVCSPLDSENWLTERRKLRRRSR